MFFLPYSTKVLWYLPSISLSFKWRRRGSGLSVKLLHGKLMPKLSPRHSSKIVLILLATFERNMGMELQRLRQKGNVINLYVAYIEIQLSSSSLAQRDNDGSNQTSEQG